MLPDTPQMPRWTMVLAVLTALVVAGVTIASLPPTPSQPAAYSSPAAGTPIGGPVSTDDRALLVALRQQGLWAAPVSQQARQMAANPAVRTLGGAFAVDLEGLSGQVRAVADRLGVALPSQPSSQQQAWSAQISSRSGADYDRTMLSRLRTDCTNIAALIQRVRTGTRNLEIRRLADQAGAIVARHLAYLDRYSGRVPPPDRPTVVAPAETTVLVSATGAAHNGAGVTATPAAANPAADTPNPPATEPVPSGDRTMLGLAVLVALAGGLTLTRLLRLARRPARAARRRH